ncbi:uncharacterized protein YKR070W-like isoform X2 [Prosopis cineraria]|uniref:uncharacterized protein YKR070W-like isoform X2 n=1 Tax=Prosopis cineraria TaxID=364024 RepID=UPI00240F7864|nr:uncharacterized protein YKR070W-like isoform X2 [Prosopis cineraria]XP_054812548.1 uncharacterized protein YKR070W-like isoform X2 [Prosopis cineraria]
MTLRILTRAWQSRRRRRILDPALISRSFSELSSRSERPSFGIAFDIDGVIVLGNSPIGGSAAALRRLYDEAGKMKVPYVFLTNVCRFQNELIVAVGKGEPAAVMSEYGFKNVISIDEYASCFEHIDPLAPYKKCTTQLVVDQNSELKESAPRNNVCSERVRAAFVVSDPVDWSRDIQVLSDILRTGGLPGRNVGPQPHLFFANDDLEYQTAFPSERLGMGAFRIALESIFNRIHPHALEYTSFGKPHPSVFKNAELVLEQVTLSLDDLHDVNHKNAQCFKTLYMIGDNPAVDIKGARQAGHPWFSILTRTGVFKGKENHHEFPADLVVDNVEEAVDYILAKECVL